MKKIHLYDRWISMNITNRKQVMDIDLSECIDEFGNSFGKNGNHFFIQALNYNSNLKQAKDYLKQYYKNNKILSVDQVLKIKSKNIIGTMYYSPWEEGRARELSKFKNSHKIGPTPDEILDKITKRLFDLFFKIKKEGYSQVFRLNGYPRCFQLKINNKKPLYLCRDGQHRLAILSYLGFTKIKVCYEADFWEQSSLLKFLVSFVRQKSNKLSTRHLKIINPNVAKDWPHVKEQNICEKDAVKFFYKKFNLENIINE